jgi:acyl-CoA synthetase (AMP-forming)/AMP-acid ligase II
MDRLAVVDRHRRLTAGELEAAVGAAAARLRSAGVVAGDAVLLVTGNEVAGVVAYHAILRLGGVAVALDRRAGHADVRHALDAIRTRLVVLPDSERERLLSRDLAGDAVDALDPDALNLDALVAPPWSADGDPGGGVDEPDAVEVLDTAPATVLFTSGTTNRPKAVVHSRATLAATTDNFVRILDAAADESLVAFLVSPLTSSAGICQVHLAARVGGTLVLEDRFEPEATLAFLHDVGANFLGGAPVIAERLLDAAVATGRGLPPMTMALGGALLPRPVLELATDRFGVRIARVYGSSEAPNFSGSLPEDDRATRLGDDGALMAGNEVRIGSSEHPEEGMLRGPCVFVGYLDPDDNAAAFEDGWYRTGDTLEVRDGRVTVTGRIKEIVNRNGLKVSLHEVDDALHGLPGAAEVACFGVPDDATGERLCAAVRVRDGARVSLDDVIAHLQTAGLATRKLPEQLVRWDEPLPRTGSGKIVRTRLATGSAGRPTDLAPRLR